MSTLAIDGLGDGDLEESKSPRPVAMYGLVGIVVAIVLVVTLVVVIVSTEGTSGGGGQISTDNNVTDNVTYSWGSISTWLPTACPATCGLGGSDRTRTIACTGKDGGVVGNEFCDGVDQPVTSLPCPATEACVAATTASPAPPSPVNQTAGCPYAADAWPSSFSSGCNEASSRLYT